MLAMCKGLDRKRNTVVVEEDAEEEEGTEEGAFSVTMIVSGLGVTTLVTTWGGAGADCHTTSNTDGVRVRAGDDGGLRKQRRWRCKKMVLERHGGEGTYSGGLRSRGLCL